MKTLSVNELLELWGSNAHKALLKNTSTDIIAERKELNAILKHKGVANIEIYNINNTTMTLRYLMRGNFLTKSIALS